jgi:hypothetical protein
MRDDRVRDDIALIREAIEEGRGYATASGPGLMVWGIALAAGFVATYAFDRGYQSALPPAALWPLAIAVPWAYWLFRVWRRVAGDAPVPRRSPMVMALRMLWLGLGIFLTTLTLAVLWSGEVPADWLAAVVAGAIGTAVFATAWLAALPWLRWVALAWWVGELALVALRHRPEALLLSAAMMLALLAGPGLVLVMRRRKLVAA